MILAVLISYILILNNRFTFDDYYSIEQNRYLHNITFLKHVFTDKYFIISNEASFRPAITILNFIEYYLFGNNPVGFHAVNILLHLICVLLVFVFFRLIFSAETAFLIALLHAVHPGLSEPVAQVAFGEDLLCFIFVFLSLIFIKKWFDAQDRAKRCFMLALVMLMYSLALCSKEMAFFFPIGYIVLMPFMTDDKKRGFTLAAYLMVPLLLFMFVRFFLLVNPNQPDVSSINPFAKWFGLVYYFPDYLKIYFFPKDLSIVHLLKEIPPHNIIIAVMCWLFIVICFFLGIFLWLQKSVYGAGILWTLLSLAPVSGFFKLKFPFAERYLYIPSIGIHIILASVLIHYYSAIKKGMIRRIYAGVLFVLVFVFILRSIERTTDWFDNLSLWKSTVKVVPYSPPVHYSLGLIYHENNEFKKAEKEYMRSIKCNPDYLDPYINLAVLYFEQEFYDKALKVNYTVLAKNQNIAIVHFNIGLINKQLGNRNKEFEAYMRAVKADPSYPETYKYLAAWHLDNEDKINASLSWEKAVELDPYWVDGYLNLHWFYGTSGKIKEAEQILKKGLFYNPGNKELLLKLYKMESRR